VKEMAFLQMSAGATPSNVHAVREAALPLSSTNAPTLSQLKNWKHVFFDERPSGNDQLIVICWVLIFCLLCFVNQAISWKTSSTSMASPSSAKSTSMMSDFGSDLITSSNYVICDGTFDTTKCKLVLTTLLGFHEGIAIPCAYLSSNSKKADNYESFYQVW
jgi:hypothetical protein